MNPEEILLNRIHNLKLDLNKALKSYEYSKKTRSSEWLNHWLDIAYFREKIKQAKKDALIFALKK